MRVNVRTVSGVCMLLMLLENGRAVAQPAPSSAPGDQGADAELAEAADDDAIGLDLALTAASVYNWRGRNMYQRSSQHDQHGQLAPSVTYTVPGTGLSFNYWSSYQTNGGNALDNIDAGIGAEQDLTVKYAIELTEATTLSPFVAVYAYPFASEDVTGVSVPVYVEPSLLLEAEVEVDLSLLVAYTQGAQSQIAEQRYLYQRGGVSRTFELGGAMSLGTGAGYGYKLFFDDTTDNAHDVQVDATVGWEKDALSLTPGVHWAWTNLSDVTFSSEQFVWLSLDVGYSL